MPDRALFDYVQSHFLGEPERSRFVSFWQTAESLAALPNRNLIPRLAEAFAHCLRESLGEIPKSGGRDGGRWSKISREVVDAKTRYDTTQGLPADDIDAALVSLLETIDDLSEFHEREPGADVRGLTNLIFEKTGARLVEMSPHPAVEFHKVRQKLQSAAHSSGDWDEVLDLRVQALSVLTRLFRPPEEHLEGLKALAAITDPSPENIEAAVASISNEHHLRYFTDNLSDFGWLTVMGPHELFAPSVYSTSWPVVRLVSRMATAHSNQITDWLVATYDEWATKRPNAPAQICAAARVIGPPAYGLMLRTLQDFPTDVAVRRQIEMTIAEADPASDFVTDALVILLSQEDDDDEK